MIRNILLSSLVCLSLLSGCFVDPGPGTGTTVSYSGDFAIEDGRFKMTGEVELLGGNLEKGSYRDIQLELYTKEGELIYKQHLGTLRNFSDSLNVSVNISTVPYYVILDSPNIFTGPTEVDYWVREKGSEQGYDLRTVDSRDELPIEPKG